MSGEKQNILLIRETVLESWARDASTFALFVGLIGVGWFLQSEALQWVGAVVAFITVMFQSQKRKYSCSISEARKRLDEMERKS